MLEEEFWTQRERTKAEGFGKPLDIDHVGGGPIDWFACPGMPFGDWEKPCAWCEYSDDSPSPTYIAQQKQLFRKKKDEEAGALG